MMARRTPHPILKWPGGKARIAGHVLRKLPDHAPVYHERMIGGGVIFFELARMGRFDRAVVGDTSPDLMNVYRAVKNDVDGLIKALRDDVFKNERASYVAVRAMNPSQLDPTFRAARTIYLNKTCFNGLHRVNKRGMFNVPFGGYENPKICNEVNLRACSSVLARTDLLEGDFDDGWDDVKAGEAVFFDPPYVPASITAKFTNYTLDGFTAADQARLERRFRDLHSRGLHTVLTNSAAALEAGLYEGLDVSHVSGFNSVGGPAKYRGKTREIIVTATPASVQMST